MSSSAVAMPSPRPSPAMRPQSPFSPRYDHNPRFDNMSQSAFRRQAGNHSSATAGQRRANAPSLRLPSLPRFHPANYSSSQAGSAKATPDLSDTHKQRLAYYQHELLSSAALRISSPAGPHLVPTGSPGPVTPLELEAENDYLVAGAQGKHGSAQNSAAADELVERLIRQETGQRPQHHRRSNETQQPRSSRDR